jgi:hypothetical protein
MKDVIKQISQVRSEMRFYSGKEIPDYSCHHAERVVERLKLNADVFQRRLKHVETSSLQRQHVMRELVKLHGDVELFLRGRKSTVAQESTNERKIPVLKALSQLCDKLAVKPMKRQVQ